MTLATKLFKTADESTIDSIPGFRRCDGEVELESGCCVPAELYLFRAPRSYTRQDCVEFHVPGSPAILTMLMRRMMELGARTALPGEFTARAYLNGAMDLTRAEAVAAVIHARSDGQLLAARSMMEGRLADRTDEILEQTAELVALVEADIDFAEEPIEFITPADLKRRVTDIADQLAKLVASADSAERIDVLPRILLVGRSNAGKSTLMNALSGMDRSICSPVPGTTRDLLSAPISLGAAEAVLIDAAGVDDDMVDLMRVAGETTAAEAARVDLVCLVVDLSAGVRETDFDLLTSAGNPRSVVIGSKMDLLDQDEVRARSDEVRKLYSGKMCAVSAQTGDGLDECRRLFAEMLHAPDAGHDEGAIPVTARQRDAIDTALAAFKRCAAEASNITETIDRADILAFELREALDALGSISGNVTTEDLLGKVFASFCIGK